jgi:hypothetical protein
VVFVAIKSEYSQAFDWPEPNSVKPKTVGEVLYDLMAAKGWKGAGDWKRRANEIAPTIVGGSKKHGGPDLGPTRAKRAWVASRVRTRSPPNALEIGEKRLGRSEEAIAAFRDCFDLAENIARRDANDAASRVRIGTAGIELGNVLRYRAPGEALVVYDAVARRLGEVRNDPRSREDQAIALAGSSYALLRLHRNTEAKQRIDAALTVLKELKEYPAERMEFDDPAYVASRALADYEGKEGDPHNAVRLYEQLLDKVMAGKSGPYSDLKNVTKLSQLYESLIAAMPIRSTGLSWT